MNHSDNRRLGAAVVAFLLLVITAGIIDLALDRPRGFTIHVAVELGIVLLAAAMAIFLWSAWLRTSRSLRRTQRDLATRQAQHDHWRRRAQAALAGLGTAIAEQLLLWELTPSEREVAFQLVRGLSHKQIARLTGRSERTVRQHAIAVYQKAGVAGRAELAAFFLRDIVLPGGSGDASGGSVS